MMVTMVAFSISYASCKATETAPPDEIPAKIPSSQAKRLVISSASLCDTDSTRSTRERSKISGRYASGHLRIPPDFGSRTFVVRQRIIRIGELVEDDAAPFIAHLLSDIACQFHAAILG